MTAHQRPSSRSILMALTRKGNNQTILDTNVLHVLIEHTSSLQIRRVWVHYALFTVVTPVSKAGRLPLLPPPRSHYDDTCKRSSTFCLFCVILLMGISCVREYYSTTNHDLCSCCGRSLSHAIHNRGFLNHTEDQIGTERQMYPDHITIAYCVGVRVWLDQGERKPCFMIMEVYTYL